MEDWEQKYNDAKTQFDLKEQERVKLKEANIQLSERLSKEMGEKVSANESVVENISIKNRPMNIAEDYARLQTEEWFEAIECIQGQNHKAPEEDHLSLLCTIIQVANDATIKAYSQFEETFEHALLEPKDFAMEHFESGGSGHYDLRAKDGKTTEAKTKKGNPKTKSDKSTKEPSCSGVLPVPLTNAVGDFLRNQADTVDFRQLVQVVTQNLKNKFPKTSSLLVQKACQNYITATVKLCWKMVIQRPPMKFDFSETRFGENVQELYWGSDDSKESSICLVYPLLKHGDRIVAKGKIYLYKKTNHGKMTGQ